MTTCLTATPATTGMAFRRVRSAGICCASTKSAALGFLYLFVFSLGMCTLLVAIGASSGFLARLPRAGAWMVWIKRIFALAMIGVAEYYLIKMGQVLL